MPSNSPIEQEDHLARLLMENRILAEEVEKLNAEVNRYGEWLKKALERAEHAEAMLSQRRKESEWTKSS